MAETFQQFVEEFIEEVITDMNLSSITDDEKTQLHDLIRTRVDKHIMALILRELTEEQFKSLSAKLEEKKWTEEEQQDLFAQAAHEIPGFEDKLAESFYKLKEELLQDAEELKRIRG